MNNLKWMAVLGVVLLAGQVFAGEQLVLKTQTDKESYSTGINIVRTLKQQGGEVNLDVVIQGIKDGLTGDKLLMTEEEIGKAMAALQTALMQRQKQAANQRDKTRSTSADAGQNSELTAPQKQVSPEQGDDHVQSNAMFAKDDGGSQKPGQGGGVNDQVHPMTSGMSVAERGQYRSAIKNRALELRKRTIEQGLQQTGSDK